MRPENVYVESREDFSQVPSEEGTWFPGLSLSVWSAYLLWSRDLNLRKGMDPYRNFVGEQSARFKFRSRKFSWENEGASEGYTLGTGIAISAMLPLLVLSLATMF